MNYTDEQLQDLLAYGPTCSLGESRALIDDLVSARAELKRARDTLELPGVKVALIEAQRQGLMSQADKLRQQANSLKLPDQLQPHSRACGPVMHEHGFACHNNCPTCGGVPLTSSKDEVDSP